MAKTEKTPKSGKKKTTSGPFSFKEFFSAKWTEKNPILIFVGLFVVFMGIFYLIWVTPFFKNVILANIISMNAVIGGFFLNLLGQNVTANGSMLLSAAFSMNIKEGCDAVEPVALFVFAVLAFPMAFSKKWPGIIAGVVFLLTLNIFRIITLYFVGAYWPSAFDFMHVEFWQVVFILLAIICWGLWIQWASKKRLVNEAQNPETE